MLDVFIECYRWSGEVFVVLIFSERKIFIIWRLINSVFVNSVGTTYNINKKFLSIICTMLSREVLLCSSRQTTALHTTEILTGISIEEERKTTLKKKPKSNTCCPFLEKNCTVDTIYPAKHIYAWLYNNPTKHIHYHRKLTMHANSR